MAEIESMPEVVLYIDTSYSKCGSCGKDCDPYQQQHDTVLGYSPPPDHQGCHARYTHLSSHYAGQGIREAAQEMRPDLPWKPRGFEEIARTTPTGRGDVRGPSGDGSATIEAEGTATHASPADLTPDPTPASAATHSEPQIEPETEFRVPSSYQRCRRPRCQQPPVADMRRERCYMRQHRFFDVWWGYCADHLADYNCEVRDGRVWRRASPPPSTRADAP